MNAVSVDDIHHYSHIIGRHTTINDAYIPSTDLSPGPWEFYCAVLVMSGTLLNPIGNKELFSWEGHLI